CWPDSSCFFFSSRRRHTRSKRDWSSDVCSSDLVTRLVADGKVDPCLSKTYAFDDIPECHQLMLENNHPYGNMAVLVNARTPGQRSEERRVGRERSGRAAEARWRHRASARRSSRP